jgi:K+/H+ antiporter YhaU regulatory subunit KhtT
MLPTLGTVLQEGDVLYLVTAESELERISQAFARVDPGGRSHGKGAH